LVCAQRLLAGLLVLAGLTQCPLRAQTNATKAAPPTDRYLLIVETSKSMQRRADAVLGVVQDMLMSGLNGQFRAGGTLGVWTFNEDLSAGRFPLEIWSSSAQKDITQRTLTFLKGQKYEKQANFDKVAPALGGVISDSKLLTVILIASGDWKMRGTPFDNRINESYQQWRDQQQKARMPFVTILRVRNGQVGAYAVNTPPWPLQVPRLAEETKIAEAIQDKLLEALHNAPASTVAPLIISGRKSKPEPAPAPMPEPVVAKAETPPPVAAATVTNQSTIVKPPEPAAPPVEVAKAEPAPVVAEKPVTESTPKPAPAPIPTSEPKPEMVKAPEAKPAEPAPAKPEAAPPPPVPMPKPEPVAVEQPKPSAAPEVKAEPAPAPAATREAPPAATPSATAAQATASSPTSLAPPPSSRSAPPAQAASAAPAESLMRARNIWIAALLLAVVAVGIAFLLMRRSRTAPQGSLITRSFEREKGP
jgi:hypothetical protein